MNFIDFFGYSAALLTTIAFIPQAYKVIKTKDAKSLSLTMFLILTFGFLLWLIYGILREDKAIIIANTITGILSIIILITKLKFDVFTKKEVKSENKTI